MCMYVHMYTHKHGVQVICAFVASKIITIFTQQYLPFFFLDTLNMNQVSIIICVLCNMMNLKLLY